MTGYIPLGRDHELRLRAECLDYARARDREAFHWRWIRRVHGHDKARAVWMRWRRGKQLTFDMMIDNLLYGKSAPTPFGTWLMEGCDD